jgi:hypothetical protein
MQVTIGGSCDTLEFRPIKGFVNRKAELNEVRTVGVSLMVSPISSVLAEGGIVVGLQAPEGVFPHTFWNLPVSGVAENTLDLLLASKHAKSLNFKDGMYGWHKPTCENDLAFHKPFVYNAFDQSIQFGDSLEAAQAISYRGNLHPPGGWMMIGVKGAPNTMTGTSFPGCIVKVTAAVSLNFDTESLWYHVEQSNEDLELVEVRRMLDGVEQFTENPFHFSDISRWIGKNAGTLKSLAKAGLTTLTGAFVPEATAAVAGLNTLW